MSENWGKKYVEGILKQMIHHNRAEIPFLVSRNTRFDYKIALLCPHDVVKHVIACERDMITSKLDSQVTKYFAAFLGALAS